MGLFGPNVKKLKKKMDVMGLTKALSHKNPDTRISAARALGDVGDARIVVTLLKTLTDRDWRVQCEAIKALGNIGDANVVEPLIQAWERECRSVNAVARRAVRQPIIEALTKIGEPALEPLVQLSIEANLRSEYEVKQVAEDAFSRIIELTAESHRQVLKDKSLDVRIRAVEVLGEMGDLRAVQSLIHHLKDESPDVRTGAVGALGKIGGPRAVQSLIHHLKDESPDVRIRAAEALGQIGDVGAIEPLFQAIDDGRTETRREVWFVPKTVRGSAWDALKAVAERIGEPLVDPAVRTLGHEDPYDREKAADLLETVGSLNALPGLCEALKDCNEQVQSSVRSALTKIVGVDATELLERASKGEQEFVAPKTRFLSILDSSDPVIGFIDALEAESQLLRHVAVWWLTELDDRRAVEPLAKGLERGTLGRSAELAEHVLACFGDKRVVSAVIDRVMNSHVGGYPGLFEDYNVLISKAVTYSHSSKTVGREDPATTHTYRLHEDAVRELCQIDTPVSTNILHKLAEIPDTKPLVQYEHALGISEHPVSFGRIREIARNELKRRGNPPYNPAAYLVDGAWRLTKT